MNPNRIIVAAGAVFAVAVAASPASASATVATEFAALESSALSHRVAAAWAAAFASPEWQAVVEVARSAAPTPTATMWHPPTLDHFAQSLRDLAANGLRTQSTDPAVRAGFARLNAVAQSAGNRDFVARTLRLLALPGATNLLSVGPAKAGACDDDVDCRFDAVEGGLYYAAGTVTLLGCAAVATCGPAVIAGGVLTAVGGAVAILKLVYRQNRPQGTCTDSANIGTYVDGLGYRWVAIYSRISCSKPQRSITVGDYVRYNGNVVGSSSYSCSNRTLCEPTLLWGPNPPHGQYAGGNGATATYDRTGTGQSAGYAYQHMSANTGTMNYNG